MYMRNVIFTDSLDEKLLGLFNPESEVQLLRYNEPNTGLFIAESTKVIERALDAGLSLSRRCLVRAKQRAPRGLSSGSQKRPFTSAARTFCAS